MTVRELTPAGGVEVMVGRRQLTVDGSYHALSGIPKLRFLLFKPAF